MARTKQLKAGGNPGGLRQVRKIAVLIVGGAIVLVGIAMLVLPGPAFVVIPAGIAILATEFDWARRWGRVIIKFLKQATSRENIKRFIHENSLALTLFLLFFIFLNGQILAGYHSYNAEQEMRGGPGMPILDYLLSGPSLAAIFKNWQSEFLRLVALVWLSVYLRQQGAAHSKLMEERQKEVTSRRGRTFKLAEHSLSLVLLGLFALSFILHAITGTPGYNAELARYGGAAVSWLGYLGTSRFWFESFQNWQGEFLSLGLLLVLSMFLREKGSVESKPMAAPRSETRSSA